MSVSQNIAQVLIPLHGKFFQLNDLHINRGHYHVGLIKTLCLLMLSWIFTDDFWLRVGPKAFDGIVREASSGLIEILHRWEMWAPLESAFVLLSGSDCLPDEWSHFRDCSETICSSWHKSLSSGGLSSSLTFIFTFFFFFPSNLLPFKWKPTDGKRDIQGLKRS